MVNYYSSSSAITANFESASGSFGSSDGYAYQSAMSGYNGSGFGVERGVVNQTIPPTIDGQPLGEIDPDIFKNLIDVTINSEIKKIVSTFDQYKILNYYKDERGNVRMVTKIDTSDDIVIKWEGDYSAYGMLLTGDIENLWLPLKTYALHEHDIVSGLVYAQARWYDPETGSFISEDPIKDGNNYYAYCGGNPIGMVDPTGLYGQHNPSGVGFGDPDQYYKDLQYGGYNAEQGIYDYSKYKAGIKQWQEGAATSHGNSSSDDLRAMAGYRSSVDYGGDSRWFTGDGGMTRWDGNIGSSGEYIDSFKSIEEKIYYVDLDKGLADFNIDWQYNYFNNVINELSNTKWAKSLYATNIIKYLKELNREGNIKFVYEPNKSWSAQRNPLTGKIELNTKNINGKNDILHILAHEGTHLRQFKESGYKSSIEYYKNEYLKKGWLKYEVEAFLNTDLVKLEVINKIPVNYNKIDLFVNEFNDINTEMVLKVYPLIIEKEKKEWGVK